MDRKYYNKYTRGGIEKIKQNCMSDDDIRYYLPNVPIIRYNELKNIKSIDQILPKDGSMAIILQQHDENEGHWVALSRYKYEGKTVIEYFCSYGLPDSDPVLKWNSKDQNERLGIFYPYLHKLLKKCPYDVLRNAVKYQSSDSDVASCGRHCTYRLLTLKHRKWDLPFYQKILKYMRDTTDESYDDIVCSLIQKCS